MNARLATAALVLPLALPAAGEDWHNWRGPHFNGSATAANLPVSWSDTEGVVWRTRLPGQSAATPAVAGGRVYLTAIDQELRLWAMCLDRASGAILWQRDAGLGAATGRRGMENSLAEPSPVADAQGACFGFGTGLLVAFDADGTERWRRDLVAEHGPIEIQWAYASSPMLVDSTVYVQVIHSGESYVMGLDFATGRTLWRQLRPDAAHSESREAYTTPIPLRRDGGTEILVLGGDCVTAHDPATGAERWRWSGLNPGQRRNFRVIPSPVVTDEGLVLVNRARGGMLHALRVEGGAASEAWSWERPTPDVVTPLVYRGRVYVMDGAGRRRMACLEPATGKAVWEAEIETTTFVRASPTAGDGKIYVMDAEGLVTVLAAGDEFAVLGRVEMGPYPCRSSIVIHDDQLLIRTAEELQCIGAAATLVATEETAEPGADAGGAWPSFRGPGATGIAEGHALPVQFGAEDPGSVRWSSALPGLGHSSPVVWGERLFVTTAVKEGADELVVGLYGSIDPVQDDAPQRFEVHCLDRRDGSRLWARVAHEGVPRVKRHPKSSHASPTPATDGRHVVAFFGSEGLHCYDMDGTLLWKKDMGMLDSGYYMVPDAQWGFASSPLIHQGRLILLCDVQKDSFLAALDVTTGQELWRVPRSDVPTWGTPAVADHDGTAQVIVNGYYHTGGYDLSSGGELWRLVGGGDIPVPTPVVSGGVVYITNAHGRMSPIYAVRLAARGVVTPVADQPNPAIAWWRERQGNYMQTPIVYGDLLYTCNDAGILRCWRAGSGEKVYEERLGSGATGFTASPVGGDGKLYFTSETGEVHVVRAGAEFERLAVNELGETCMATPAICRGTIYFRTRGHVTAVAAPPATADR
jgi:outer membrane protein assembly factor BamB